ncbi:hypothetical protein [Yersinia similis]|uniref:Bacteriophage protein n=1 Tax=Yersinia similis TaxID=367190 RepID=A0A0T9PTD9_9GAMM|nr:hypothetical protein [Yersinia similis]BET62841.1 hypothetical protein YPSE1_23000 [Yersinia pseudotuberculosis]CNG46837.1 Uncharacterised protein [Yersinia similis]CNH80967.1 Uncharacterised protein [Yersinia similis]
MTTAVYSVAMITLMGRNNLITQICSYLLSPWLMLGLFVSGGTMIRNYQNGDIITHGTQFATGKEATRQAMICCLRLFLGEYFLNATEGTPWFQSILGKTSQDIAEANIKQRLLAAKGVLTINRFEMDLDMKNRKITVFAAVIDIHNDAFDFLLTEDLF